MLCNRVHGSIVVLCSNLLVMASSMYTPRSSNSDVQQLISLLCSERLMIVNFSTSASPIEAA